jgi:hypothetical protein
MKDWLGAEEESGGELELRLPDFFSIERRQLGDQLVGENKSTRIRTICGKKCLPFLEKTWHTCNVSIRYF